MENSRADNELKKMASLFLITAMTILAVLIVVLNRILGWEIWILPVIVVGAALCWSLYIFNQFSERARLYFCGVFFVFLEFYYCVKIRTVHDCGTVLIIMIILFAFTRERALTWFGVISAIASLIFHLLVVKSQNGLSVDLYNVVRTVMVFLMVPLSAVLVDRIIKAWTLVENNYIKKIAVLADENERINNFLANVSHEVRTPISAVIGLSYVLQKEELEDTTMTKVKSISDAGHRVAEQISDILDFTEIDMNKIAVRNENYSISSTINDLLNQLSQSEDNGLDLVVDIDANIPSVLIGDESKIKRILWHIIRNGIKFTKEGGVYVHLHTVERDYGVNLVIEVVDTGIGMNEDGVSKAYEKFYQTDSGITRAKGGLGLGLSVVNGFTSAMGGVLSIDSTPGQGTTVMISIPQKVADKRPYISLSAKEKGVGAGFLGFMTIAHPKVREFYMEMITHFTTELDLTFYRVQSKAELEKLLSSTRITHLFVGTGEYRSNKAYIDSLSNKIHVALVADMGFDGEASSRISVLSKPFYSAQIVNFLNLTYEKKTVNEIESVSFPGLRTLVVDDEHMNLIVAREIFEAYGMIITTASSGEEAIEKCEKQDFDIVFMDHMMPGMDGVETMKRIKENMAKKDKQLIVVALTANAISTARQMFMAEGFDGFISKPIEVSEFERVLKSILPKAFIVYTKEKKRPKKKGNRENKEEIKAPVDPLEILRGCGVDTDYGLEYCGGEKDFYYELLADYADKSNEKLETIGRLFRDKDYKNYEIRVHGVKSTSKLIGAMDISEKARLLEFAAKNLDEKYIADNHGEFLSEYEKLMDAIGRSLLCIKG